MARWWVTRDKTESVRGVWRGRKPKPDEDDDYSYESLVGNVLLNTSGCQFESAILGEIFPKGVKRGECVEIRPPLLQFKVPRR